MRLAEGHLMPQTRRPPGGLGRRLSVRSSATSCTARRRPGRWDNS